MAKLHFPRKNISLDMTAMCDVAFLLLTFFMLATKFRPDEPVIVDTPSSISQIKLPETDVIQVIINREGAVFFGIDNQKTRQLLIEQMASKYNVSLTDAEKYEFIKTTSFGVPMGSMKQYLSTPNTERSRINQPGIPADSSNNQLKDWVDLARRLNERPPRVAIKGDQSVSYKSYQKVVDTLQELNINRFNMITSLEARPEGMVVEDEAGE